MRKVFIALLLVAALKPGFAQVEHPCDDPSLPVIAHPADPSGAPSHFAIAPVYRAIALPYPNSDKLSKDDRIASNRTFCGAHQQHSQDDGCRMEERRWHDDDKEDCRDAERFQPCGPGRTLSVPGTAVPGIFSLCARPVSTTDHQQRLDVSAFATCPRGQSRPVVECYRLTKRIPGSMLCPATYSPQTYVQFGSGVRTWWTLLYTQPGTTFTLEMVVRCKNAANQPVRHIDRWTWKVVATLDSLRAMVDMLHSNPIGLSEVPCIVGEDLYRDLHASVDRIEDLLKCGDRKDARWQVWQTSALILASCAFTDCFIMSDMFGDQFPPGNDTQFGPFGLVGIMDTIENPCCCALLANLEFIANKLK